VVFWLEYMLGLILCAWHTVFVHEELADVIE
jgi:hypothetical protein